MHVVNHGALSQPRERWHHLAHIADCYGLDASCSRGDRSWMLKSCGTSTARQLLSSKPLAAKAVSVPHCQWRPREKNAGCHRKTPRAAARGAPAPGAGPAPRAPLGSRHVEGAGRVMAPGARWQAHHAEGALRLSKLSPWHHGVPHHCHQEHQRAGGPR